MCMWDVGGGMPWTTRTSLTQTFPVTEDFLSLSRPCQYISTSLRCFILTDSHCCKVDLDLGIVSMSMSSS